MNAADQRALGALLDRGLAHAGVEVVRGRTEAGNVVGWEPLTGVAIVGALLARKLVVRLREPAPAVDDDVEQTEPGRALRIVRGGPEVAR